MYSPGVVIAEKYRLVQKLGEGGMGTVWLGHNVMLDSDVAIKLIRQGLAAPEARARLLQEARAAARLSHPSIVRVFDFGQTAFGDPFIVMERLTGESLGRYIDRYTRVPAVEAVALLLPVVSALQLAHAKGVIHRDLKPDNVLLVEEVTGGLRPKLVDFGLAKSPDEAVDRALTLAGTVLGSPDYMSPEQARGRTDIDWRTDVWSITVVLYEMITGRRPFDAPNYNALITSIVADTPVPTVDLGAGDAALWSILERGLRKDPLQRWSSTQQMLDALVAWGLAQGLTEDCTGARLIAGGIAGLETSRSFRIDPSLSGFRPTPTSGASPSAATLVAYASPDDQTPPEGQKAIAPPPPAVRPAMAALHEPTETTDPGSLAPHATPRAHRPEAAGARPARVPSIRPSRIAALSMVGVFVVSLLTSGVWMLSRSAVAASAAGQPPAPGAAVTPTAEGPAAAAPAASSPEAPDTSAATRATEPAPRAPSRTVPRATSTSPAHKGAPTKPATAVTTTATAASKAVPLIPREPNY
jgi:serine/threonine-protein kinase